MFGVVVPIPLLAPRFKEKEKKCFLNRVIEELIESSTRFKIHQSLSVFFFLLSGEVLEKRKKKLFRTQLSFLSLFCFCCFLWGTGITNRKELLTFKHSISAARRSDCACSELLSEKPFKTALAFPHATSCASRMSTCSKTMLACRLSRCKFLSNQVPKRWRSLSSH